MAKKALVQSMMEEADYRRLKELARREDRTVSSLVARVMKMYLNHQANMQGKANAA